MGHDEGPRSAYELAMARLRQKDADEGVERAPLTEEQKAAIAEARSLAEARIAELRIMLQTKLAGVADPLARAEVDEEQRREVQRVLDERDRKIERIRAGA